MAQRITTYLINLSPALGDLQRVRFIDMTRIQRRPNDLATSDSYVPLSWYDARGGIRLVFPSIAHAQVALARLCREQGKHLPIRFRINFEDLVGATTLAQTLERILPDNADTRRTITGVMRNIFITLVIQETLDPLAREAREAREAASNEWDSPYLRAATYVDGIHFRGFPQSQRNFQNWRNIFSTILEGNMELPHDYAFTPGNLRVILTEHIRRIPLLRENIDDTNGVIVHQTRTGDWAPSAGITLLTRSMHHRRLVWEALTNGGPQRMRFFSRDPFPNRVGPIRGVFEDYYIYDGAFNNAVRANLSNLIATTPPAAGSSSNESWSTVVARGGRNTGVAARGRGTQQLSPMSGSRGGRLVTTSTPPRDNPQHAAAPGSRSPADRATPMGTPSSQSSSIATYPSRQSNQTSVALQETLTTLTASMQAFMQQQLQIHGSRR